MNGLSDVRLTLHGPQLLEEREVYQRPSSPAGLSRWGLFWHRSRTRRVLLSMDDQQLRDIGLSRAMAQHEGCKPFWRS